MKKLLAAAMLMAIPGVALAVAPVPVKKHAHRHHQKHHQTSARAVVKEAPPPCVHDAVSDYRKAVDSMHVAMMAVPYTGNTDTDFAAGMVPHHQGAVEMANVELEYGHDPVMRALAKRIISAQQLEISAMNHWLDVKGNTYRSPGAASTPAFQKTMQTMHHGMEIEYTGDADVDFARGMIPHHQGAIDMADVELAYGRDEYLRQLARDIIRSQAQEIHIMQEWLAQQKK